MKKTIRIMLCIMLMAYCTLLAEEPSVISIDTDADTLTVTQDTVLSIEADVTINNLTVGDNEVSIVLNNDSVLTIGTYSGERPIKGDIAIKYLDGSFIKSPRFDSVEGCYIEYGGILEVNNLLISRDSVDFSKLADNSFCTRDTDARNLVSGLVQNEGINNISYDADNYIYTVTLEEDINRNYLEIELLFDLEQWGNVVSYKSVDQYGNDIEDNNYSFVLLNNRVNGSLFDEGISYLIMAHPVNEYEPFSMKIYDPYDENNYRYINVILSESLINPEPIQPVEPVVPAEPEEVIAAPRPVVDTCAR